MSPLYTLSVTDPQANLSFGALGILLPPLGYSFPLPEKFGIAMWPSNTQSLMPNCSNYARSLAPSCNLYIGVLGPQWLRRFAPKSMLLPLLPSFDSSDG